MTIQIERLSSLIDFCHQSARLRGKANSTVSSHNNFSLYESDLIGWPGVKLNLNGLDESDEVWLRVERLHETKPPETQSELLRPWLTLSRGPTEEPTLKKSIEGKDLIDSGKHQDEFEPELQSINQNGQVLLADYSERSRVVALHCEYIKSKWIPWSVEEKTRLKTIRLYAQLFALKQQVEGDLLEAQVELVWGMGLGIWKTPSELVNYPLLTQLCEISFNKETSAIEVRPRDVNPRIELDWYAAQDNPGVSDLEKLSQKLLHDRSTSLSPFDRGTFEPLLRSAVTFLDANGIYWPNQSHPDDRTLPRADENLKVTDTWVLFARPRTNSSYLQDLERLKDAADEADVLPGAAAAIVSDPEDSNHKIEFSKFRGLSASYHDGMIPECSRNTLQVKELFFPKPFNDEQVKIVQLLEIFDGVVAQGPPGTGKTHTIANIICHYLASGKRVLVTSMKDPALGVLKEQLPDEIRPLAISLLTSDQVGLKQFEYSILKIASEVQAIDRSVAEREIKHLDSSIEILHGKLAKLDWDVALWGKKNLNKIVIDGVELDPVDAAKELTGNEGLFAWLPDPIDISDEFEPRFNDHDIVVLRSARSEIGDDIVYLNASLPQIIEFPDSKSILQIHQDLRHLDRLKQEVEAGNVPDLIDTTDETIDAAVSLSASVLELKQLRNDVAQSGREWIAPLKRQLISRSKIGIERHLHELGKDLISALEIREDFLNRPVSVPFEFETQSDLIEAVDNLAGGKSAFGISGFFGKSQQKKLIDEILILGKPPSQPEEWNHVKKYILLLNQLRELIVRWNALTVEIVLPVLEPNPLSASIALECFKIFRKIKQEIALEERVFKEANVIFPNWSAVANVISDDRAFYSLDAAIRHHLMKDRLANVWSKMEQTRRVLEFRKGPIISKLQDFLDKKLGNPSVPDGELQATWLELMAELSRVLALRSKFDTVERVTALVSGSGAPKYSALLRESPVSASSDYLLPSNWRQCWKLKRLDTYLKGIDAETELKQLARRRASIESDLSKAYRDVVVKRTWLQIAENASPSIRSALQAFVSAIQKIGKGTGKRAVRYRQDARNASALATAAVPCWIMPHYRISESLPPQLGLFDLVIVDEASQSDLSALPAILRAKKVLIVGDDKQVSPEGVGLEEEKIRNLMGRFLSNQVEIYRSQMSPERSIYDLFKVVFANSSVMLKEHFRCVGAIIEYSKREFYNHELRPLRLPKASERLDPPLIDVLVQDGFRDGDVNRAEAVFIVEEIEKLCLDEKFANRTIGVVSLLGDRQAYDIWNLLERKLGPDLLQRHKIACGDARTFQGKERDVIFLSMIVAPNEQRIAPLSREAYAQRFNVAASRARDRMYLVRSVSIEHLSDADRLRRSLISHFSAPFAQDEIRVEDLRRLCESPFEREVYDALTERGFFVTPQIRVGQFRIDLVVEGSNDSRLAVECDGDRYHGPDKWAADIHRQRILERAGWVFWRCFASTWVRRKSEMIDDLILTLREHGIEPTASSFGVRSVHTETRAYCASESTYEDFLNRERVLDE